MGFVYLLHFEKPYKHARHYLGFSETDPRKPGGRIEKHSNGNGSRLCSVIKDKGIKFVVARVWENVDRCFERKKKGNGGVRACPICRNEKKKLPQKILPKSKTCKARREKIEADL